MTRIRGAIIDELRSLDWVPRSVRSRAREIEAAQAKLEHELQRAPTEAELADKLGHDRGGAAELAAGDRQLLGLRARRALDRLRLLRRPGLPARHDRRRRAPPTPRRRSTTSEVKDRLTEAIASLPEREQLVVALYYYENLTLREIGEVLGVTESRVSQLHTKAVMRLKSGLQAV